MLDTLIIESPLNGTLIELAKVNDKIFSSDAAGRGIAIKNPDGKISAPFGGIVKFLASPSIIGLKSFKPQVETTTPVVVTNPENFGDIIFLFNEREIIAQRSDEDNFMTAEKSLSLS